MDNKQPAIARLRRQAGGAGDHGGGEEPSNQEEAEEVVAGALHGCEELRMECFAYGELGRGRASLLFRIWILSTFHPVVPRSSTVRSPDDPVHARERRVLAACIMHGYYVPRVTRFYPSLEKIDSLLFTARPALTTPPCICVPYQCDYFFYGQGEVCRGAKILFNSYRQCTT
jgi:hypothetical protein